MHYNFILQPNNNIAHNEKNQNIITAVTITEAAASHRQRVTQNQKNIVIIRITKSDPVLRQMVTVLVHRLEMIHHQN